MNDDLRTETIIKISNCCNVSYSEAEMKLNALSNAFNTLYNIARETILKAWKALSRLIRCGALKTKIHYEVVKKIEPVVSYEIDYRCLIHHCRSNC